MSESEATPAVVTNTNNSTTMTSPPMMQQQQPQFVEADSSTEKSAVLHDPTLASTLDLPAGNPMDELDTEEDEEEGEDATCGDAASPSATVVPSNTPVTADSGQGSPTMQSSSDSLSDDIAGQDLTNVAPDSSTADLPPPAFNDGEAEKLLTEEGEGQDEASAFAASAALSKDTSAKEAKKLERKEEKKKHKKKEDKGIEYILRALNSLQTPEEKLAALCKKYADLNEEHRVLQTSFKTQQRTMTMVMREKDQLQADHTRAMMAKSKLESLCRELQKHNKIIKEESVKRAKEDDEKRKEISVQFNNTISEIQTQMSENTERNTKLRQENENLASQLKAFISSIELRDQQVEKMQKHHELEKKLFDAKIKQAEAVLTEHSEKNNKERELVMLKLAESNKKNAVLEAQVSMFKERYAEFEQLHSRSSETFQKYKTEMDKMTKRIKKLEKDGLQWKTKWEKTNKALIEQVDARSKSEKETLTYAQKTRKLESLCRALQAELHNKKPAPVEEDNTADPAGTCEGDLTATSGPTTSTTSRTSSTASTAPPNSPEASSSHQQEEGTAEGDNNNTDLQQQHQPSPSLDGGVGTTQSCTVLSQEKLDDSVSHTSTGLEPSGQQDKPSSMPTEAVTTVDKPTSSTTSNGAESTPGETQAVQSPDEAAAASNCDVSSHSTSPTATLETQGDVAA